MIGTHVFGVDFFLHFAAHVQAMITMAQLKTPTKTPKVTRAALMLPVVLTTAFVLLAQPSQQFRMPKRRPMLVSAL